MAFKEETSCIYTYDNYGRMEAWTANIDGEVAIMIDELGITNKRYLTQSELSQLIEFLTKQLKTQ